ncbi:MAG: hypothetical protein LBT70_00240 [Holosporaceae bacterium]|jgi:hypothetical protein|nr:hypothetical protein [Holosporaceae bacterium]
MSYDLNVYVKHVDKPDLEKQIIKFFSRYGLDLKLHPEFDLLKNAGCVPAVISKESKLFQNHGIKLDHDALVGNSIFVTNLNQFPLVRREKTKLLGFIPWGSREKTVELPRKDVNHLICCSSEFDAYNDLYNKIFSAAVAFVLDGALEDPQMCICLSKINIADLIERLVATGCDDLRSNSPKPYTDWYDRSAYPLAIGVIAPRFFDERKKSAIMTSLCSDDSYFHKIYTKKKLSTMFLHFPTDVEHIEISSPVYNNSSRIIGDKRYKIADRKKFPETIAGNKYCTWFYAEIPIVSIKIEKDYYAITVSGVNEGKRVGFKIKIPNTFATFTECHSGNLTADEADYFRKCFFIANNVETINFFNALDIGNFKKIKEKVEFNFIPIVGDSNRISEFTAKERTNETAVFLHGSDPMAFLPTVDNKYQDVMVKFSLEMYDRIFEYIVPETEKKIELSEELELLMEISFSKKVLRVKEENPGDRHNLKHAFMDYV